MQRFSTWTSVGSESGGLTTPASAGSRRSRRSATACSGSAAARRSPRRASTWSARRRCAVATGILNIWQHEPADVAAAHAEVTAAFPDRFLLGIGVGHPEATRQYRKPLTAMREFFDGLDAAQPPVPRDGRIAAALGPKMLDLAAERSLGTHPYFTPVEHTRFARERVGPDALVAPELAVVVEPDAGDRARAGARVRRELPQALELHAQPAATSASPRRTSPTAAATG